MRVSLEQLRTIISETVKNKLVENKIIKEGAKEIQIRMTMDELKDVIVDSITEDLVRELNIDEAKVAKVVSRAYDKMTMEIVLELDKPQKQETEMSRKKIIVVR